MGGLIALLVIALWLALCVYLARRIPHWLGMQRFRGVATVLLVPVLLVLPMVDEIVGMRQFEQLCKERAVVWVSPDADRVTKARIAESHVVNLSSYWVDIQSHTIAYLDAETGKPFYTYEALLTKGGRIARIALMGGTHSCTAKNIVETSKKLNIDNLIEQGKKS